MVSNLCGVLILVLVFCVHGEKDMRSNIVFVIDDTISMSQEIRQVKENVQEIFAAVLGSKKSQIGEFILITFNDYEVSVDDDTYVDDFDLEPILVRTSTRDPDVFAKKLGEIKVDGGGYCPELCLSGIKRAIEESNPNSYIYVFTDASAKDYKEEDTVRTMAEQKSIQITFLLTDDCDGSSAPDYVVYDKLAKATSGEVFHLKKKNIDEIMKYIIKSIDDPKTTLIRKTIGPGVNKVNFTVDGDTKHVVIGAGVKRNTNVNYTVTDPDGNEAPTKQLVNTDSSKASTITNPTKGTYTATVNSESDGTVTVKASIDIQFQFGFSGVPPTSMNNTRTRPVPDIESYLAIKLQIFDDSVDAKLKKVLILDIEDKQLMEIPANVLNKDDKFYSTTPFKPPNGAFKVAIVAVKEGTDEEIVRVGRTPVEAQTYPDTMKYKRPELTIDFGPKISVKYGNPITLECKVNAYPKPKIIWEDKESGTELASSVSILDLPYDYISILKIENVTNTRSYKCKASIDADEVTDEIEVATSMPMFWNIIEEPKDTDIEYKKDAEIHCKVNAWPLPMIIWYRDDNQLTNDDNFQLSEDKMTLSVKNMLPELEGKYSCKASNDEDNLAYLNFTINMSGGESPILDKTNPSMSVEEGKVADIPCRIIKGTPTPTITWEFKVKDSTEFIRLSETEQMIHIDAVELKNAGIYKCTASNRNGDDFHETDLTVQCPPEIDKSETNKKFKRGSEAVISCRILKGIPKPDITWEFKRQGASDFVILSEKEQDIVIKAVDLENSGLYRCKASNDVGNDSHEIESTVECAPEIDKSETNKKINRGSKAVISCRIIKGIPKPEITWEFKRQGASDFVTLSEKVQDIVINSVDLENSGLYRCKASNDVGNDSHEIEMTVEYAPTVIVRQPGPVKNSDQVTLHCEVTGEPEPVVRWSKEGKTIITDAKYTIFKDNSLRFITTAEDIGNFTCEGSNDRGKDSKNVTLDIYESPTIDKTNSSITVEEAMVVDITCRVVKGIPTPTITWEFRRKDSKQLIRLSETGQEIHIDAVDLKNAGVYKCTASNRNGDDFHEIDLTVQCLPKIDKSKSIAIYSEGSKAVISCRIIKGIPKPDITWEFKRKGASDFIALSEKDEDFVINAVELDNGGTYKCEASNAVGKDGHVTELTVENAPNVIVEQPEPVKIGDQVTLHCEVTGEPDPIVRWSKEGKTITADAKYTIFKDNSLRFTTSYGDIGNYTCEGNNYRGKDSKNITLDVYGPVKIQLPNDTLLNPSVGNDVELWCNATGHPKPSTTWKFLSSDSKNYPVILPYSNPSLKLNKIKAESAGYYICVADNTFDNESITYEVKVNVPVEIEKPLQTVFNIIEYDLVLRIPCKAKGYPEPTVTWMVNGFPLTLGFGEFDGEPDGTLVIMLPDKSAENTYVCMAANSHSDDSQSFTVNVASYPIPTLPMKTIYVEKGSTRTIPCDLPYTTVDSIRWYKDGTQLGATEPEFKITDAMESDSGTYSCRVSSILAGNSSHMKIVVGTKPSFVNPQKSPNVPFIFAQKIRLDCEANGIPTPTITWWHNDTKLTSNNMVYELTMYDNDIGEKRCEVTNEIGTVTRTFAINNKGCVIDFTKEDLNKYHPLIVTGTGKLNEFENKDGIMIIPETKIVTFKCPNKEKKINCINNEFTDKNGIAHKYDHLKCDSELRPKTKELLRGKPCSNDPKSALISVGYRTLTGFSGLYDVCYSKGTNQQIFIKYNINHYASNIDIDMKKSFTKDYTSYKYDEMFHCDKTCCFSGRQLVSVRDLPPGLQKATYFNINVVPEWNLCGNFHNWNKVEKKIRDLAKTIKYSLELYAGGHENQAGSLEDKYSNKVKMSKYLWKVVQIKEKRLALAIIILNVPNLTAAEAKSHVFCKDICDRTDWMASTEWRNEKQGYTFCCNAWELAKEIGPQYQRIFKSKLLLTKNIT